VGAGAFWASTELAATIITHARITRLIDILPVGPDKPSFPPEEGCTRGHATPLHKVGCNAAKHAEDLPWRHGFHETRRTALALRHLFWKKRGLRLGPTTSAVSRRTMEKVHIAEVRNLVAEAANLLSVKELSRRKSQRDDQTLERGCAASRR
jgi:hypothetical protein